MIALLSAACVDQVEVMLRSLHELMVDLYLVLRDERAMQCYVDFVSVEQAVMAAKMDPAATIRPRQDLVTRRRELGTVLRGRLRESHPEHEEALPANAELNVVLDVYSRRRFGSRHPRSWKQEYRRLHGQRREDIVRTVAAGIWEVLSNGGPVLLEGWNLLLSDLQDEFDLMYGHWSSAVHNSPLAMNRKVDPGTMVVSIHGTGQGAVAHVGAAMVQFTTLMMAFEFHACDEAELTVWKSFIDQMGEWADSLHLPPSPFPETDDSP